MFGKKGRGAHSENLTKTLDHLPRKMPLCSITRHLCLRCQGVIGPINQRPGGRNLIIQISELGFNAFLPVLFKASFDSKRRKY